MISCNNILSKSQRCGVACTSRALDVSYNTLTDLPEFVKDLPLKYVTLRLQHVFLGLQSLPCFPALRTVLVPVLLGQQLEPLDPLFMLVQLIVGLHTVHRSLHLTGNRLDKLPGVLMHLRELTYVLALS
jgi:hypothetical protein